MKKLLALIVLLATLVALVGCFGYGEVPTRGVIKGNVYTNEYAAFTFTKPSTWRYYSDEEIAAAMDIAVENLGDKYEEAIKNNPNIYDMMVAHDATGTNISVSYENLRRTLSADISMNKYISIMKRQLSEVEGVTVTFTSDGDEKVKLGENEYTKCTCLTKMYGYSMTQVFYLRKADGYMTIIIVTTAGGHTTAEIEAMFS
ncbi:MAG: hypothetical protein J6V09_06095 [Clostridia bacterium]|nr:hypothetical protein [Clostridia bacterium]